MENNEEDLKASFYRAEAALVVALNGMGRPIASQSEAVELRRAIMLARARCEEAGIMVETLWEASERRRKENEQHVRDFAAELKGTTPKLPRAARVQFSIGAGVLAMSAILAQWQSLQGFAGALVGGLLAFALVDSILSRLIPTPAIRVGRYAARFDTGYLDLWPDGSESAKDFDLGYRIELLKRRQRGEMMEWIRTR